MWDITSMYDDLVTITTLFIGFIVGYCARAMKEDR